jgi:hypothetical protein
MWLIPPSLQPYVFIVVVAIVAVVVRRTAGWKWLVVVCLGLSALLTGLYVIWIYRVSPLSPDETHMHAWTVARILFLLFLTLSRMVVWLVALIVPPPTALEDAPSTGPLGQPEDTHELLGIPRRYQALLAAQREARQRAVVRPWYRTMFRLYVPSYLRQDIGEAHQLWRTPDVFKRDFIAAAPVLTELSQMPTAGLSALEAYHRVNLRRVRRRLRPVRIIPAALLSVAVAASRALPSGTLTLAKLDVARASILAFVAQPQYLSLSMYVGGFALGFIAGSIIVWWMQRRLEVFGELLTVALAHRRGRCSVTPSP